MVSVCGQMFTCKKWLAHLRYILRQMMTKCFVSHRILKGGFFFLYSCRHHTAERLINLLILHSINSLSHTLTDPQNYMPSLLTQATHTVTHMLTALTLWCKSSLIKWLSGYMSERHPRWWVSGHSGVWLPPFHVIRCQRVSPTCPRQGECGANPWGALP